MEPGLWDAYVEALEDACPNLGAEVVASLWAEVRRERPGLRLEPATFGRALASAQAQAGGAAPTRVGDLALATAGLHGDAKALEQIDAAINTQASRVAARTAIDADELAQQTRVRVLLGDAPRLATYVGRGSLASWLRMVAGRLALDDARSKVRAPEAIEAFCEPIARSTPELRLLEQERRDLFVSAFRTAYSARSEAERAVLKGYFVRGQTLAQLGRSLGVHTSTAARRLAGARDALLEDFHRSLRSGEGREALALLEALRSRLELDPKTLLKTEEPSP